MATASAAAAAVLAATGAVRSATLTGTAGPDRLIGTPNADAIRGRGGHDRLEGRSGRDLLSGDPGRDRVSGGAGRDRIAVHADGGRDSVRCGDGRDLVNAELRDAVAADCELVARQLSRDPFDDPGSQHETQVEPDSFAWGNTVVAAFQIARSHRAGAAAIGWSTSGDGGRSWRSGILPRLTRASRPAGRFSVASDPVVAYAAAHHTWLVATVGVSYGEDANALLVSRSRDGLRWSAPVTAGRSGDEDPDKEWLACDNWPSSRFRGRCYLTYMEFASGTLRTRRSNDGGLTWSASVAAATGAREGAVPNGAQPVVRPDGSLVVVFAVFGAVVDGESRIAAVRSTDGGLTFSVPRQVSQLELAPVLSMRAPPFPSVDVDTAGRIYAAWSECRYRYDCSANDVVLATSRDGVSWATPRRVPAGPLDAPVDHFTPGLAVDPATAGSRARVAVAYHSLPQPQGCREDCPADVGVDVALVESADGGRTWSRPERLNAETMPLRWIAESSLGRFLGDYISASYAGGRAVPVFALAAEPVGGELRQAIFAARAS